MHVGSTRDPTFKVKARLENGKVEKFVTLIKFTMRKFK